MLQIISRALTAEQLGALNPHYYSQTSSSGQGEVTSPQYFGATVAFYAHVAKDVERDSVTLKVNVRNKNSDREERWGITALFPDSTTCTWSAEGVITEAESQAQLSLEDPLRENISSTFTISSSYTHMYSYSSKMESLVWNNKV